MPYTPPAGDLVPLTLSGSYTPPAGDEVALDLNDGSGTPPAYTGVGLARRFGLWWDQGSPRDVQRSGRWRDANRRDCAPALRWATGTPVDHPLAIAWSGNNSVDRARGLAWDWGTALDVTRSPGWRAASPVDTTHAAAWNWAEPHDASRALAWGHPPPRDTARRVTWNQGEHHGQAWRTPWAYPPPKDVQRTVPWGWGTPLSQQYVLIPPPVPIVDGTPPCYLPPPGDRVPLAMSGVYLLPPGDQVPLRLVCGNTRVYVLRRTAIMQHSFSVCRLRDRLPLNAIAATMGADRDSWAWSIDLQLVDRASYHAVLPDGDGPKLIEINASGHIWTALVERATERRVAPADGNATPTRFSIAGRSRTAILAAPYAVARSYVNPAPTTAAQAAARELEFTGFTLDWQVDDWAIPAGAWRYEHETPMSAILRIAATCGAVVQSHPETETVIVKPAYAAAPWNWATETPAVILDGQSLIEMGREWRPGPQYLGVYVSGETQGVLVNVIRQGSAGSPYAQMIVDPLVTAIEPARGRGTREIADSQNQTVEPVVLPLMPAPAAPGVVLPTELVQVEDPVHGIYKAQATGTSIAVSLVNDAISIRQTVTLARHYPVDLT